LLLVHRPELSLGQAYRVIIIEIPWIFPAFRPVLVHFAKLPFS